MLRNATLLMQALTLKPKPSFFSGSAVLLTMAIFLLCYYNPDLENQLITDTQAHRLRPVSFVITSIYWFFQPVNIDTTSAYSEQDSQGPNGLMAALVKDKYINCK